MLLLRLALPHRGPNAYSVHSRATFPNSGEPMNRFGISAVVRSARRLESERPRPNMRKVNTLERDAHSHEACPLATFDLRLP
jgi:hypothetical protein